MKAPDWKQSAPSRFENLLASIASLPEHSVAIVGHHDFFRSYLGASFDFAEVRRYTLEGGRLRQPDGLEVVPVRARARGAGQQDSGCIVGCFAFLRPASKHQQTLPKSVLDRERRYSKDEVEQQALPKGAIARQRRATKELYEQEVELERKRSRTPPRRLSGLAESTIEVDAIYSTRADHQNQVQLQVHTTLPMIDESRSPESGSGSGPYHTPEPDDMP